MARGCCVRTAAPWRPKAGAVPGASVGKPVGEDEVTFPHQGRDHPQVRQVSAAEDERTLGPLELGEQPLELGVRRMASRDEPRSPAPAPYRSSARRAASITRGS